MKHVFTFLILVFIAVFQSFSQPEQTLDYYFSSSYEKQVLTSLLDNEYTDIIPLFLASDPENDAKSASKVQKEIDRLVRSLCKRNLEKRSPVRMVKRTYYAVHRKKLHNFRENAAFSDVFNHGEFNCVTATALIAHVFDELGITYSIRLAPGHVFLIAETEHGRIFLETTDPENGFIRDNKYLYNRLSRYVPRAGWGSFSGANNPGPGKKNLASFFLDAKQISLKELAGIQFYNEGVSALEKKDFKQAFHYFRVASHIYKSSENDRAMHIALMNFLHHSDFSGNSEFDHLLHLVKVISTDNDRSLVLRCFQKLSDQQLFGQGDAEAYSDSYFRIYTTSSDKAMRTLLQGFYLYNLGRFSLTMEEPEKAVRLLEKASEILPNTSGLQEVLEEAYAATADFD